MKREALQLIEGLLQMIGVLDQLERVLHQMGEVSLQMIGEQDQLERELHQMIRGRSESLRLATEK